VGARVEHRWSAGGAPRVERRVRSAACGAPRTIAAGHLCARCAAHRRSRPPLRALRRLEPAVEPLRNRHTARKEPA
jgi:hypothetical protein